MEILYLLIPISLVLLAVALWGFFWAVKNGQFDDMDSPALSILDDEQNPAQTEDQESSNSEVQEHG